MDALPTTGEFVAAPSVAHRPPSDTAGRLLLPLPWSETGTSLAVDLDRGATCRLVCRVEAQKTMLLEYLKHHHDAVIVSQNGGLLNHLSMRENLFLPSVYRLENRLGADQGTELERDATDILGQCACGATPEAVEIWLQGSPARMGKLDKRLAGFVRALLSRPEILVFDHVFEGLTRAEAERVLVWRKLFHRHFPFRTLVFVDLDFQGLPRLDDCITASAADARH